MFQFDLAANPATPVKTDNAVWPKPIGMFRTGEIRQADSDGILKIYLFHAFTLELDKEITAPRGCSTVWLTVNDIQKSALCPISGSARAAPTSSTWAPARQVRSSPMAAMPWPP